jgi:phage shock protein B
MMHHSGSFFVLGILFLTIVAPLWISAHYGTRWRKARGISREDEKTLTDLLQSAQRIERRVEGLEKLLDVQSPGWRQTP